MGALHEGHLQHFRALRPDVDLLIASIYVNPRQFGPHEDLARYPRDLDGDARMIEGVGCDLLFAPNDMMMYPPGYATTVTTSGVTDLYEGAIRPDHFRGVTTVVCKLLNLVRPHLLSLGQKDAQQVAVLTRMIVDLNLDVELRVVETIREADGLAMSSRNAFLSADERRHAASLYRALRRGHDVVVSGGSIDQAEEAMRGEISSEMAIDYCAIVDAETFRPVDAPTPQSLAIVAARIGATRLIDNLPIRRDD